MTASRESTHCLRDYAFRVLPHSTTEGVGVILQNPILFPRYVSSDQRVVENSNDYPRNSSFVYPGPRCLATMNATVCN